MRIATVLCLLALPCAARADRWTRGLDDKGGGGAAPAAAPATTDVENDLASWAGEPQPIELPALLAAALKQAPALQNARIDIAIAEAQIGETWARKDWRIAATANGSKTISAFAGQQISSESYGGTGDLTRNLSTNGQLDFHVSSQYTSQTFPPPFGSSQVWQDQVDLQLTQPLLKGRGSLIYDATERKARLSRDSAELARRLVAIQTVQNVVSAYWDLVLAERQVAITEQSLALARERLRVTQIAAQGGKTAPAEIPAVQQIIATREEDVLSGELNVLTASIALRRASGMPIGAGALGLRVPEDLEVRDRTTALGPLVERTYQASPELAQLAKQDASATIDIEVTENGYLPQLDALVALGPLGQEGSFVNAAHDLATFKNIAVTGSLTFSRSIGQRDVVYRSKELRSAREKLRVNAFDLRAQLAQGMAKAVAQLELANRRVVLSRRAIDLAKENIRIETDRFNLGTRTNFDVLNRLEDLRQAQLREMQALIDWHKADTVVQALTGDILPAFGITVQ